MVEFSRVVFLYLLCVFTQTNANSSPKITNFVYRVCEDIPIGEVAFTIDATDAENDPLTFSLSGVNAAFFEVETNTGRVTVKKQLDKESIDLMFLGVTVSDGVNTIKQDINVLLLDANDNRPIFEEASYDFSLPENTAVGSSLFRVRATDADTGLAGTVRYSIDKVTPSSGIGLFGIAENTGAVTLLGNPNTELSTFYSLQINATDSGGHCYFDETIYLSGVTFAFITVEGLHFIGIPYVGSVEENSPLGTFVLNVTAASQNTGDDYRITYSIEDATVDSLFAISSDEGIISVSSLIDREEIGDNVTLTVEATESNLNNPGVYLKVRTSVQIVIIDVNDNKPEFYKCGFSCVKETNFTVEVFENLAIGSDIYFNMTVKDADKYSYRHLTLGGADKDVFVVSPEVPLADSIVWLVVRQNEKLDYEKTQQMIVEVMATDGTNPQSTATVTINIMDVNDNSPKFPQSMYTLNVTEHADVGTVVATITATDADDPDTENSKIIYSIEESKYSNNFTIDSDTGVLRNNGELDREALDPELDGEVELNVTATDKGTPPLSTSVLVIIEVEDINDNKPQFAEPSYQFSVKEGEKGTFVGSVTAEDLDQTRDFNRISFGIVSGSFGSFIIRTYGMERGYRGNITVDPDIDLDYESERKQFTLRVEAADLDQLSAEVTVVVNVEDVNDERPEFLPTPAISVKENTTIIEPVGKFVAVDKDTNHSLVYELDSIQCRCDGSMKPCSYFIVDPTGEVRVNPEVTVDYEECDQVVLEAQVVDEFTEKGENNSATPGRMELNIEDINDNIPEFIFSDSVFVVVSETAVQGTSVARVAATDRDSGINRQIEFEVTMVQFKDSNNQTITMELLFEAVTTQQKDVYVGTIQTIKGLDVTLKGKYLVTVTATDTGDLSTSTVLEILTATNSTTVVLEFSSSEEEVQMKLNDIIRELTAATEATVVIVTIRPDTDKTSKSSNGTIILAYFVDSKGTALTADEAKEKISNSENYEALEELGLTKIGTLPGPEPPSDAVLAIVLSTLGIIIMVVGLAATVIYTYKGNSSVENFWNFKMK